MSQPERDARGEGTVTRRQIGPESEVRGGPEALEETLDEDAGDVQAPEPGNRTNV